MISFFFLLEYEKQKDRFDEIAFFLYSIRFASVFHSQNDRVFSIQNKDRDFHDTANVYIGRLIM